MEETRNQRYCRKCLTRDMIGQEEYFKNLREYIANIEPELKASEDLYEKRLALCKACDLLLEGMCRSCGCYVELRAAMKKNACPVHRWESVEGLD